MAGLGVTLASLMHHKTHAVHHVAQVPCELKFVAEDLKLLKTLKRLYPQINPHHLFVGSLINYLDILLPALGSVLADLASIVFTDLQGLPNNCCTLFRCTIITGIPSWYTCAF